MLISPEKVQDMIEKILPVIHENVPTPGVMRLDRRTVRMVLLPYMRTLYRLHGYEFEFPRCLVGESERCGYPLSPFAQEPSPTLIKRSNSSPNAKREILERLRDYFFLFGLWEDYLELCSILGYLPSHVINFITQYGDSVPTK